VSVEVLKEIEKAEKKANSIILKARVEGEKLLEKTRKRVKEEILAAKENANLEISKQIERAKKENEKEIKALFEKAEIEKDKIRVQADKHQEEAISFVLKRILE